MFRDRFNVKVVVGDTVEKDGITYTVRSIMSFPTATVVIAENLKTHQVDTLLLRDVKKIS